MDVFNKIENTLTEISICLVIFVLIVTIIYLLWKFHGKSISKSIALEKSLQQLKRNEKDVVSEKINRCVNRSTVRYFNNKKNVELLIPTKRLTDVTSQIDVKQKIEEKIKSSAFRSTLNSMFPNHLFESEPIFYKDMYILKGDKR